MIIAQDFEVSMSATPFNAIVVLTGAGISAESGVKTFRDSNGLWENEKIEDVATPEAFQRDPERVHRFYNARRAQLNDGIKPNAAHVALAEFEQQCSAQFSLVTQNVDNLHEKAGSRQVLHMHGELLKARCQQCFEIFDWNTDLGTKASCQHCKEAGLLRPHIVWFGEMPFHMAEIEAAISACDLFVSIGTSGNVYPAAGFVEMAASCGAHTVELNLEPSNGHSQFAERHYGPASETVPAFFNAILAEQ
jgi:NAD-dependent deacetylase